MADDNNLNTLLEDALEDLLLEDKAPPLTGDPSSSSSSVQAGDAKLSGKSAISSPTTTNKGSPSHSKKQSKQKQPKESLVLDEKEMDKFFASMTEKLNSEMPPIDPSESVPQIMDLMQNLLSRELLYPALKDLSPKFEEWLQKNLSTLEQADRKRFRKQLSKINEIIDVFDDESLEDRERFEKNLTLMEQMQSLGAPPEELTVPDGMSKCSIM